MLGKALVFDVMLKDKQANRLYEAPGCTRLGWITHDHSGALEEPGAVYVAPSNHRWEHMTSAGAKVQGRSGTTREKGFTGTWHVGRSLD